MAEGYFVTKGEAERLRAAGYGERVATYAHGARSDYWMGPFEDLRRALNEVGDAGVDMRKRDAA